MTSPHPATRLSPVIRVFISSTFSDMRRERNALQEFVYPKLERLCLKNGFQFQAIDLRWGVSGEAGLEHRTMRICLEELRRSQEVSPEPNFLILLGDRYGWRPLPEEISQAEFDKLAAAAQSGDDDRAPIQGAQGKTALQILNEWYRCDENVLLPDPAEDSPDRAPLNIILQPRTRNLGDGRDYTRTKDDPPKDTQDWIDVQQVLWRIINAAFPAELLDQRFDHINWPQHIADLYDARHPKRAIPQLVRFQGSATEQEIWCGALSAPNAERHVLAFFREIANRDEFAAADLNDFFDLTDTGGFDTALAARQTALKTAIQERLGVGAAEPIPFSRLKRENGKAVIDASKEEITGFCDGVESRLRPIIERQTEQYWRKTAQASAKRAWRELEIEQQEHARVGQERGGAEFFVGREEELAAIHDYLRNGSTLPLVVCGASGSGKTALLARATQEAATLKPLIRLIGVHPRSSDLRGLLSGLCQELRLRYPHEGETPTDIKLLEVELQEHFRKATREQPLILFLDALDQLADTDGGRLLHWIPTGPLPAHVKIVVSCLSDRAAGDPAGKPYAELMRRRLPEDSFKNLDAFSEDEAITLLFKRWLPQAKRAVSEGQRALIKQRLASAVCRQPIYLKLLFEEARLWRSYDAPPKPGEDVPALLKQLFDRLKQKSNHGSLLVERVSGYLAASRHGLAENEILEVLFRDREYKTALDDASKVNRHEMPPDAKRIPIAIWSRLRFDLASYLTERAVPGANVLTFYHRQVAEWVQTHFGDAAAREWQPHRRLGVYFRSRADPTNDGRWRGTAGRPLEELFHHLREAGQIEDAARLMRQLRYLDARCAYAGPFTLDRDFGLLAGQGDAEAGEWHDFLQPRVDLLRKLPDTLPALVWHEAPAPLRKGVEEYMGSGAPRAPWLKLDDVTVEEPAEPGPGGPALKMAATCKLRTVIGAIAGDKSIGFYLESLGSVAIINLMDGSICPNRLRVPRKRLLAMAASKDGEVLAVVDEQGGGLWLPLRWPADGAFEPEAEAEAEAEAENSFRCCLPEDRSPVIAFADGRLCWQAEDGRFCQRTVSRRTAPSKDASTPVPGEIRGVFPGSSHLLVWSVESKNSSLLHVDADGGAAHRRALPPDVYDLSLLRDGRVLCLCLDGTTRLLSDDGMGDSAEGPRLPGSMAGVLPFGQGAVFFALDSRGYYWSGAEGAGIDPLDVFPVGYGAVLALAERGDDVLLIMSGSAFRFSRSVSGEGRIRAREYIWAVFPGEKGYHAVVDRQDGAFCVASDPASFRRFETGPSGPLEAVADASTMILMKRAAESRVWNLPDGLPTVLRSCPGMPEACASDGAGRFWLVNSLGEIHSLVGPSDFVCHTVLPVNQPRRQRLLCGLGFLFWTGLALGPSKSGTDNLETLVVYRVRGRAGAPLLELAGQRTFDPDDGLWTLSLWDEARQELACVLQHQSEHRHIIRVGRPEEILESRERVIPLHVAETELWAALPFAGDRAWLVRSTRGVVMALAKGTFEQLAAFRGTHGCSILACLPGPGRDALLVEAFNRVLRCSLAE